MKKILFLSLTISSLFFTSCATSVDAFYAANADKYEVKTIYLVVKNPPSDMEEAIRKDLLKRKLNVVTGPNTNKITDADAIMKANETWKASELTSSITALDITLFNKNGELIASSHWKNSKFSMLATLSYIASDAIDIIFEKVVIPEPPHKP